MSHKATNEFMGFPGAPIGVVTGVEKALVRFHRKLACFRSDIAAVAAIEFGLLGLAFALTLCFVIELGMTQFIQSSLDEATRVASRSIKTGVITSSNSTAFVSALCAKLSLLQNCSSSIQYNVVSGSTFAALSTTITTNSSNQMTGTQFTPGSTGQDVVVQVGWTRTIYFPIVSSIIGTNGNILTLSTVAFQNEPF